MPDIAETDSYGMLCEDWGTAYLITRTAGIVRPYRAGRRDDPAAVLHQLPIRRIGQIPFERAIAHQLRVKPAIVGIIDLLRHQSIKLRADLRGHLIGGDL